ncbi:MAG: LicD family protein [Bacteroidales bacterium]|nr:LicD family protein [Bacteroidales bacterium]
MFTTKNILMKLTNSGIGKELSKDELGKMQRHLFGMYRDIEKVCERHGLRVSLAYGNVIGILRHNGWIPWDDDLDLHMPREDYELFLSEYINELPSKYKVSSYLSENGAYARFAKIFDTETTYVPLVEEETECSGVFIDIFPIDNVPAQPFVNKFRRMWAFFMMYTATSVQMFEDKSEKYRHIMFSSKEGKRNWRIRQLWGALFSFVSAKTWNRWIEKFAINNKSTGYSHVGAGLVSCYRMIPTDYFLPFKEVEVPQLGRVKIPNKSEDYLTFIYGDWKHVPDNEDKWHHYVTKIYIPEH